MKSATRHTGKLEIIRREKNSLNGNPRFLCRLDGWTCYTAPNDSLAYEISKFDGREVEATIYTLRGRPTLAEVWLCS